MMDFYQDTHRTGSTGRFRH